MNSRWIGRVVLTVTLAFGASEARAQGFGISIAGL